MIVILSQDTYEPTTEVVIDWIRALGGRCVRLNGEDLTDGLPFRMMVDGDATHIRMRVGEEEFTDRDVRAVWLRRWHQYRDFGVRTAQGHGPLAADMNRHLIAEARAISSGLHSFFHDARWLTHPDEIVFSKLHVLRLAHEAGLEIPPTLVSNIPSEIRAFRARHGRVITKSVGEAAFFHMGERSWAMYTAEVDERRTPSADDEMFPSLVQALVEKEFEIRAFYLAGEIDAMAIFSQRDDETAMDFRRYNLKRPNRAVPYRLPPAVTSAVLRLMETAGFTTGSLDLIRTPDGRHVFLEVNPAGQFAMVSNPCNYNLEKRVASHLIDLDRHERV